MLIIPAANATSFELTVPIDTKECNNVYQMFNFSNPVHMINGEMMTIDEFMVWCNNNRDGIDARQIWKQTGNTVRPTIIK